MDIQLSDHFDIKRLIRFVLPSIGMMLFTSIYGVVDGYFVSNFAGSTQFAAINLILPFIWIFSSVGFMIGTGGTALISYYFGQGNEKKAKSLFSLLVYLTIGLGVIVTVVGQLVLPKVTLLLGATKELYPYCILYGRILLFGIVPFLLQNLFQSFLVLAEKPKLGFLVTVLAGVTNMILDALLVGLLRKDVVGAAVATVLSQCVGGLIPLLYFIFPNSSTLRLGKAKMDWKAILKTFTNGSSEFLTNVSLSIVNMAYNLQLLRMVGEDGVTAYGVLMYVCFIFISIFVGYSIGTAPIIGFNHGAGNHVELKNVFKKSIVIVSIFAVAMFGLGEALAYPLSLLYVGYDAHLLEMSVHAFRLFSFAFLFAGFSIFGSSFFTALNNGLVSAIISFLRTLVFQILVVVVLPMLLGVEGIWWANAAAELLALFVTGTFLVTMRKRYKYM